MLRETVHSRSCATFCFVILPSWVFQPSCCLRSLIFFTCIWWGFKRSCDQPWPNQTNQTNYWRHKARIIARISQRLFKVGISHSWLQLLIKQKAKVEKYEVFQNFQSSDSFTADMSQLIGMKFSRKAMAMLIEHSRSFITNWTKHSITAPFKTLSKRRIKQLFKPWIHSYRNWN